MILPYTMDSSKTTHLWWGENILQATGVVVKSGCENSFFVESSEVDQSNVRIRTVFSSRTMFTSSGIGSGGMRFLKTHPAHPLTVMIKSHLSYPAKLFMKMTARKKLHML